MFVYQAGKSSIIIRENGLCEFHSASPVPFAHIVQNGKIIPAVRVTNDASQNKLLLSFSNVLSTVSIDVKVKNLYSRFTVTKADSDIEAFIWGPYFTNCTDECGEIVGVSRNNGEIAGIQGLNPKTIGGFPRELTALHPMADKIIERSGMREPISACAALPLENGAALQAYCRNRTEATKRDYFYAKEALVLPVDGDDALICGSSIAVFICQEEDALSVISEIEITEGLPHTLVDGEWAKTARRANASYLITDFDIDTFDEAIKLAKLAGISCLYHPGFFKNWGHFEVNVEGGDVKLKAAVEKAKAQGIDIGVHTLSNFTTTDDPYVTPVPHDNLLKMGETALCCSIDESQAEIVIEDSSYFVRLSTLNAARIGNELIKYQRVKQENGKIILSECERGAWGTVPSSHSVGDAVARLWDYDYRTLFPDIKLQREFSRRLGELFRDTGLRRTSFDGLSCDYTGHEEYGNALFVKDCYDIWGPEVMSDASGLTHYNWHMHSYMNWGEPWYADMRNGMFEYRRSNQDYFRRNLFPAMLGWFTLRQATRKYESTTPDDMNWMLSKAAGFGAGFAFNLSRDAVTTHGKTCEYLETIALWESMRLFGDISENLKANLRDPKTEWEIEACDDGFLVYPVNIAAYECSPEGAQPGMPSGADWMMYNPCAKQKLVFRMRAGDERDDGGFTDLTFRVNEDFLSFRTRLDCGQYLIYDGGSTAEICDKNFIHIETIQGDGSPLVLTQGICMLLFKCVFDGQEPPYPQVKVLMRGEPIFVPRLK